MKSTQRRVFKGDENIPYDPLWNSYMCVCPRMDKLHKDIVNLENLIVSQHFPHGG